MFALFAAEEILLSARARYQVPAGYDGDPQRHRYRSCQRRHSGTVLSDEHDAVEQSLVKKIAEVAAQDPWMKDHPPVVHCVGYDAKAGEIAIEQSDADIISWTYTEVTGKQPVISKGAADTRFPNNDYMTSTEVRAFSIYDGCSTLEVN